MLMTINSFDKDHMIVPSFIFLFEEKYNLLIFLIQLIERVKFNK